MSELLSHLHPASTRVDGSGGDGGRDVQVATPGGSGVRVEELHQPGDEGSPRAGQEVADQGHRLRPIDWTLVVPIDFTPAEIYWFDGLRSRVPFPIDRRDRTWLNAVRPATVDRAVRHNRHLLCVRARCRSPILVRGAFANVTTDGLLPAPTATLTATPIRPRQGRRSHGLRRPIRARVAPRQTPSEPLEAYWALRTLGRCAGTGIPVKAGVTYAGARPPARTATCIGVPSRARARMSAVR